MSAQQPDVHPAQILAGAAIGLVADLAEAVVLAPVDWLLCWLRAPSETDDHPDRLYDEMKIQPNALTPTTLGD